MSESIDISITVDGDYAGKRVDKVAALLWPQYSRAQLQKWLKQGLLLCDGEVVVGKQKLWGGEQLQLQAELASGEWCAQDIPVDVVYQDDQIIVINKPAGLVVHPGAGNTHSTLLNALLHHWPENRSLPRAGIVHRLDKDTSGLMVVSKTGEAYMSLVGQLSQHEVSREYRALVFGNMTGGGMVDQPVGRHPTQRTRMSVRESGKAAITHYRIKQHFHGASDLALKLETGRTHQIRVHMSYLRHALIGDTLYGGGNRSIKGVSSSLEQTLRFFPRQALHACALALCHPSTGEWMSWQCELPEDYQQLLEALTAECS